MSKLSRREFLKLATTAGVAAGAAISGMGEIAKALAATKALPPVVWLQGQSCSGCSVSILNATYPDIAQVITQVISLKYHQTLMGATGDVSTAVLDEVAAKKKGQIVLLVEGSIPTADGHYCMLGQRGGKSIFFHELVVEMAKAAQAAVGIGTCAAYGGIPAAKGNPTKAISLAPWLKQNGVNIPVLNVPGCPPHPDWMVGALAHFLWYGVPALDEVGRPKLFYRNVHENCERYAYFSDNKFAKDWGEPGCLAKLGCKGPISACDSMKRGWNDNMNSCIKSGGPCIGCTEPTYPDHNGDGLRGAIVEIVNDRPVIRA
jgi:hydrogenase small subunit